MKAFALIAAVSALFTLGQARADVFSTYEAIAKQATTDLQKGASPVADINQLVSHGSRSWIFTW